MTRFRRPILALAILMTLTGCGDDDVSLDPPAITYGEDISEMGMFVVDPRFTVAALPDDGDDWILFDDTGELLKYRDRFPEATFRAIWVHDFLTEEWVPAEDAWYVESPGFTTPMGWLVGTFAQENDARAFQREHGGVVMTWDEANDRAWVDPPGPDDPIFGGPATPTASPVATPDHAHSHG
jgi:copper chaperone NosL